MSEVCEDRVHQNRISILLVARKASRSLHQREIQFEQQINEYDKKLEQANLRNQQLEAEQTNTNARDLETLRTELQNRGLVLHFSLLLHLSPRSNG